MHENPYATKNPWAMPWQPKYGGRVDVRDHLLDPARRQRGPALNALGSIMLAMSLVIVIISYVGDRLLSRGERGGGVAAPAAITGED